MAADLSIVVTLKDKASKGLKGLRGNMGKVGAVAGKAMRTGVMAGAAGLGMLGVAAVKMGMDFEKGMSEVRTLMPELGGEEFKRLRDDVLNFSKEMGVATDQAVPALYQAISAGVPRENVMEFMEVASKAAIGGVTDLETAVDGITSVTNAYGKENISTQRAADVMFNAVKAGKTDFQQLSSSLFNVIPTAASLGITFEDVTSQLAVLTASGTPTSVATTQIRAAMVDASKGGTKLDTAIKELTGKSFAALVKQGRAMPDIMEEVRRSMPEQEFKDLFGSVEAMNAVLGVTGPNFDKVAEGMLAAEDSAGAVDTAFETMEKTASRKLQKAINILKVTLTRIGVEVLPHIAKALEVATGVLSGFISGFERFNDPDITSKGAFGFGERLFVIFRKKVYPALKSIADFLRRDFFPTFVSGLRTLRAAFEPVVRFILDNKPALIAAITAIGVAIILAFGPAAVAIAAIVGLIVILGLLRENWDEIKATVTGAVDDIIAKVEGIPVIGLIFKAAVQVVQDKIKAMISYIKNLIAFVQELVTFVKAIFRGDWAAAWDSLKEMAKIALRLFLDWLELTFLGTIKSILKSVVPWDWVKDKIGDFTEKVTGAFNDVKDAIAGAFGDAKTGVGNILNSILRTMTAFVNAGIRIANKVIGTYESMVNAIIGAINAIPSVSLPFGLGTIGIPDIEKVYIPRIPTLDKGGEVIRTGMAVVHKGEHVSRSGGDTFNFYHYGTLMGNEAEAERFASMIDARLRRKWRRAYA